MSAVIHHGPPGSYKTFSLVQRILIPALQSGRVVVTNIRGFNDLNKIKSVYGCDLPSSACIYYLQPDTEGFNQIARFFHWAPAGALIAMDEGQRVYPMREKSFTALDQPDNIPIIDSENNYLHDNETGQLICRPATLEIAFDQHRHFNWDIYISTPNISKIHGEIRRVVEWAYRHRNNSGLLPWYKNTWTEFRHDAEQNGKSISHYSGTPKRYKADSRAFACYQSTATGKTKGSSENISIFRDPKLRFLFGLVALLVVYVGYNLQAAFSRYQSALNPDPVQIDKINVSDAGAISRKAPAVSDGLSSAVRDSSRHFSSSFDLNPFHGKKIYYTGQTDRGRFLFEIHSESEPVIYLDLRDLMRLGFTVTAQSSGFLALDFRGSSLLAFRKPASQLPISTPERSYRENQVTSALSTTPAITNIF